MNGPRITGDGWIIYFDADVFSWRMLGTEVRIWKMVSDRFDANAIENEYMTISKAEDHRPFGPLFEDVAKFLNQWGISAIAEGVETAVSEEPPT